MTYYFIIRDVHLVTSWDDKGPVKIQKALEVEFDSFISGVKDVSYIPGMVMENIQVRTDAFCPFRIMCKC